MTDVLSRRRLNRATPARQYPLERAPVREIDAIEHLGGCSRRPVHPVRWARGPPPRLPPDDLFGLAERREVVRLHMMRNTVHLVNAGNCLDWRARFSRLHAAEYSAHFREGIGDLDPG
ncbi:DNA glycosylase AlkZ-like family protein [Actinomadura rudentiformis]|uniref:Uncharacterized protein n=1 Tax=Actinomadura rudentiformis TaxID=359158 RepID=A0A6H9YUI8_9ACTN|nr:crosslink repair DNA glycosylase YcaQ family protein [Actinomadura rudentiformis]KAB2352277.1 hypothetical protein F8566_00805 [Actinomadura rudentiformis]